MNRLFFVYPVLAILALGASACVEINSDYTTAMCTAGNAVDMVPGLIDAELAKAGKPTEYKIVRGFIGDEANRFFAVADARQTGPGAYRMDMADGSKLELRSCKIDGQIYLENRNDDKTLRIFRFTTLTAGVEIEASLRLFDEAALQSHKIPYSKGGGSVIVDNEKVSAETLLAITTNNAHYTDYVFKRFK